MITLRNESRRPFFLDSNISMEIKSEKPPAAGVVEAIHHGDRLEIKVGRDLEILILDDRLVIRGV